MEIRKCKRCGSEYTPAKYNQKYCSNECKYFAMRDMQNQRKRELYADLKNPICSNQDCFAYCDKFENNCFALSYVPANGCVFFKTASLVAEENEKKER